MPNIKNIRIENFKFHKTFEINFKNKHTLILGENGSGKSSIYFAIFNLFYKLLRKNDYTINKIYKYRESLEQELLNIEIIFDNEQNICLNDNNIINSLGSSFFNKDYVYFINKDILNSINEEKDFFVAINKIFHKNFTNLEQLNSIYELLLFESIDSKNFKEKNEIRFNADENLKDALHKIEIIAERILRENFLEDFKIKFDLTTSFIDTSNNYSFKLPEIILKIDELDNIDKNFNEAKVKLASITILFALIEMNTTKYDDKCFKLIVLDDFLTSLDMANRTFIVDYILEKFSEYQLIILTHNLHFNNLIENYIQNLNKTNLWNFQNIYKVSSNGHEKSEIYYNSKNSFDEIGVNLECIKTYSEYKRVGNDLRKEFEKVLHELDKQLILGKVEKTTRIIEKILLSNETYIFIQNDTLLEDIFNANTIEKVKNILEARKYNISNLKSIISRLNFLKKQLFNPSSHIDPNSDIFHKEYKKSYQLLKELRDKLNEIKSLNNQGA